MTEREDAVREARRSLWALQLELPEAVWTHHNTMVEAAFSALGADDVTRSLKLPPGVTLHGGGQPSEAKVGDLWVNPDGELYRLTLTLHGDTPGAVHLKTWSPVPGGLDAIAGD